MNRSSIHVFGAVADSYDPVLPTTALCCVTEVVVTVE
jgi:hypothetical protein